MLCQCFETGGSCWNSCASGSSGLLQDYARMCADSLAWAVHMSAHTYAGVGAECSLLCAIACGTEPLPVFLLLGLRI